MFVFRFNSSNWLSLAVKLVNAVKDDRLMAVNWLLAMFNFAIFVFFDKSIVEILLALR